jgi:hypothetical protein
MENTVNVNEETWVSLDDAARMLNLEKRYCSFALRKGYLKDRVGYRGVAKRNYTYRLSDLQKVIDEATVPARSSQR